MLDLVVRITQFASKQLPSMYPESESLDFDLHPGLLVSYTLLVRVIEPLLADLLFRLDTQLERLPKGEQFDINPWIQDQVKPALQELLEKLKYPGSDIHAGENPGASSYAIYLNFSPDSVCAVENVGSSKAEPTG